MSAQNWTRVIDDADDETARLILKLQLDDIEELETGGGDPTAQSDEQNAFRRYKAELQHHQALRSDPEDIASAPTAAPNQTVPTFECVVCNDHFHVDHVWQTPCSHWYCDDDLRDLFRASMTDQSLFPPRCCRQEIPFDDVRIFLGQELSGEFEAKQEELTAAKGNAGTYCYVSTCSTFINDADKDGPIGTCSSCGGRTCILCKHEVHQGECPEDEALRQTEALAQQQRWQRCPDCRRFLDLSIGCYHMTCPCGTQFCYVCGNRWKTCGCPQFEEQNLLARAGEVARRENRQDIAAVAENLRQNHDCHGDHAWQYVRGRHTCDECTQRLPTFIFRCQRCRMQACRRCRDNRL